MGSSSVRVTGGWMPTMWISARTTRASGSSTMPRMSGGSAPYRHGSSRDRRLIVVDGCRRWLSSPEPHDILGIVLEPDALVVRAEIHIVGIQPPVTRTLELPMDLNLAQLHEVLQATFGWTDSHLHQFNVGGLTYGAPEFDQDGGTDRQTFEASSVRLADFAIPYDAPLIIVYEYDFGDSWTSTPSK